MQLVDFSQHRLQPVVKGGQTEVLLRICLCNLRKHSTLDRLSIPVQKQQTCQSEKNSNVINEIFLKHELCYSRPIFFQQSTYSIGSPKLQLKTVQYNDLKTLKPLIIPLGLGITIRYMTVDRKKSSVEINIAHQYLVERKVTAIGETKGHNHLHFRSQISGFQRIPYIPFLHSYLVSVSRPPRHLYQSKWLILTKLDLQRTECIDQPNNLLRKTPVCGDTE